MPHPSTAPAKCVSLTPLPAGRPLYLPQTAEYAAFRFRTLTRPYCGHRRFLPRGGRSSAAVVTAAAGTARRRKGAVATTATHPARRNCLFTLGRSGRGIRGGSGGVGRGEVVAREKIGGRAGRGHGQGSNRAVDELAVASFFEVLVEDRPGGQPPGGRERERSERPEEARGTGPTTDRPYRRDRREPGGTDFLMRCGGGSRPTPTNRPTNHPTNRPARCPADPPTTGTCLLRRIRGSDVLKSGSRSVLSFGGSKTEVPIPAEKPPVSPVSRGGNKRGVVECR